MKNKILSSNFLFNKVNNDINNYTKIPSFRFAPEANNLLHLGHVKNILMNLELSKIYNGNCKLRIDDNNPENNNKFYVKNIKLDIIWLIKKLNNKFIKKIFYTSNYFHKLYQYLEIYKKYFLKNYKIIKYIRKLKYGFYKEKKRVIKLLIKNKTLKIYKTRFIKHYKTNYLWFIFPLYDWSHTLTDKIEYINYSLCSSEFINNRIFYNWLIKNIIYKNIICKQIETSRLKLKNNFTSKRLLNIIIKKKYIKTKIDPRIFTIKSIKSKGIKQIDLYLFLKKLNITKNNSELNKIYINSINKFENINKIKKIYINETIKLKLINFKNYKLIKFKINKNFLYLTKLILIDKNFYIKLLYNNIFLLKNFNTNLKLKNLKIIKCKNYKKYKTGFIKYIVCKYKLKKFNYIIKLNEFYWINNKFKNLLITKIYKELFKTIKNHKIEINTKSKIIKLITSENIIKNYIKLIFFVNSIKNLILYKKFIKSEKTNIIKFQINKV